ncbi:MAG: FxsA family protein [Planctomycetota bacterium]|nr:MAG: FxsA family protein [Planctomycetota bacterium]
MQTMFIKLFLLFTLLPFIELALLIKLGQTIGLWPTIWIQVGSGLLGAALVKLQGFLVWKNVKNAVLEGRMPTDELLDALVYLLAAVVLITPGLITDSFGILLLIPPIRKRVRQWVKDKIKNKIEYHILESQEEWTGQEENPASKRTSAPRTIHLKEGEWESRDL